MPVRRKSRGQRLPNAAYGQTQVFQAPAPVPVGPYPSLPVATVTTLASRNATVARVIVSKRNVNSYYDPPEYEFEASDSAKREQGDRYDPETGELLALGRAFQRVGREMISDANRRVRAMTQEREQAETTRADRSEPQSVRRRTKEEWERIQREKAMAQSLGLTQEEFVTTQEWREQRQRRDRVEEWGGSVNSGHGEVPFRYEFPDGRFLTLEEGHLLMNYPDGSHSVLARA